MFDYEILNWYNGAGIIYWPLPQSNYQMWPHTWLSDVTPWPLLYKTPCVIFDFGSDPTVNLMVCSLDKTAQPYAFNLSSGYRAIHNVDEWPLPFADIGPISSRNSKIRIFKVNKTRKKRNYPNSIWSNHVQISCIICPWKHHLLRDGSRSPTISISRYLHHHRYDVMTMLDGTSIWHSSTELKNIFKRINIETHQLDVSTRYNRFHIHQ